MIHYFGDKSGGFIAVDTTQRVREVPGYLFGRGADTPGDIATIQERVWNPIDLGTTIPLEDIPDDWVTALGFEDAPLIVRPGRQPSRPSRMPREPAQPREPRKPEWVENNPLPGKSFLVPLIPLDEYYAFMATDMDVGDGQFASRFPWEKTHPRTVTALGGCIFLLIVLCMLGACL